MTPVAPLVPVLAGWLRRDHTGPPRGAPMTTAIVLFVILPTGIYLAISGTRAQAR